MLDKPRNILFGFACYLIIVGTAATALAGFDGFARMHGFRFAAVMLICGLLAGRAVGNRTLAMVGIDLALLLCVAQGANYMRLARKWWRSDAIEWPQTLAGVLLGLGTIAVLVLLTRARPRPIHSDRDWWRISPLLILPFSLVLFARRRHGLGLARRSAFTCGALLLAGGFVLSSGNRLPTKSVAAMIGTAQVVAEHEGEIRRMLTDPSAREALIADDRVQAAMSQILDGDALSALPEIRDVVERVRDGDQDALADAFTPENVELVLRSDLLDEWPELRGGLEDSRDVGVDIGEVVGEVAGEYVGDDAGEDVGDEVGNDSVVEAPSAPENREGTIASPAAVRGEKSIGNLTPADRRRVIESLAAAGVDGRSLVAEIESMDPSDPDARRLLRAHGLDGDVLGRSSSARSSGESRIHPAIARRGRVKPAASARIDSRIDTRLKTQQTPPRIDPRIRGERVDELTIPDSADSMPPRLPPGGRVTAAPNDTRPAGASAESASAGPAADSRTDSPADSAPDSAPSAPPQTTSSRESIEPAVEASPAWNEAGTPDRPIDEIRLMLDDLAAAATVGEGSVTADRLTRWASLGSTLLIVAGLVLVTLSLSRRK